MTRPNFGHSPRVVCATLIVGHAELLEQRNASRMSLTHMRPTTLDRSHGSLDFVETYL